MYLLKKIFIIVIMFYILFWGLLHYLAVKKPKEENIWKKGKKGFFALGIFFISCILGCILRYYSARGLGTAIIILSGIAYFLWFLRDGNRS